MLVRLRLICAGKTVEVTSEILQSGFRFLMVEVP